MPPSGCRAPLQLYRLHWKKTSPCLFPGSLTVGPEKQLLPNLSRAKHRHRLCYTHVPVHARWQPGETFDLRCASYASAIISRGSHLPFTARITEQTHMLWGVMLRQAAGPSAGTSSSIIIPEAAAECARVRERRRGRKSLSLPSPSFHHLILNVTCLLHKYWWLILYIWQNPFTNKI